MSKQRMWGILLKLGHNMSRDEFSDPLTTPGYYGDNIIPTELLTDKKTWTEVIDYLPTIGINTVVIDIADGLQYKSHPEISMRGAWSHEELRAELARMRAMGLEPIPKLNFSTTHNVWLGPYRQMVATETFYKVSEDVIKEVCEVFDSPRLFHLGMDEEFFVKCLGLNIVRGPVLFWKDFKFLFECCEKYGARPWVWADYYWTDPELFLENMPKNVLLSNWFYDPMKVKDEKTGKYPQVQYQTYVDFHKYGFDQVPTSSTWNHKGNSEDTVRLAVRENMIDEHLVGFLTAPWYRVTPENVHALKDDALRLAVARDKFFPEEER